jgi:hypothetical protein
LKYSQDSPALRSIDVGLTYTVNISGGNRIYSFTAGTGSIKF